MKGDFVGVIVRGIAAEFEIVAEKDGSSLDYKLPGRNDPFLTVEVLNKAGNIVKKSMFATSEVISVREGHKQIIRKKK